MGGIPWTHDVRNSDGRIVWFGDYDECVQWVGRDPFLEIVPIDRAGESPE